jgi:hypothetical protein
MRFHAAGASDCRVSLLEDGPTMWLWKWIPPKTQCFVLRDSNVARNTHVAAQVHFCTGKRVERVLSNGQVMSNDTDRKTPVQTCTGETVAVVS